MNIGENIKRIRKEKGLTQKDLATSLNVSTITIQNYENNRREPKLETLNKIASILNVTINELIGNNPKEFLEDLLNKSNSYLETVSKILGETPHTKVINKDLIQKWLCDDVKIILEETKKAEINLLGYNIENFSTEEILEIGNFIYTAYNLKIAEILNRHKSKIKKEEE